MNETSDVLRAAEQARVRGLVIPANTVLGVR